MFTLEINVPVGPRCWKYTLYQSRNRVPSSTEIFDVVKGVPELQHLPVNDIQKITNFIMSNLKDYMRIEVVLNGTTMRYVWFWTGKWTG